MYVDLGLFVGVRSIRLSGLVVLDYRPRVGIHKIKIIIIYLVCFVLRLLVAM